MNKKIEEFIFNINWKHVLILLMIFLVAFSLRAHILKYDYMLEPDAFWHGRMTGQWLQTGVFPAYDLIGSYHNADKLPIMMNDFIGTWGLGYLAYKIFTFGSAYNEETWIFILRLLPPLYGAITSLLVYLLFKWAYKSKFIGYIAGFVTATMPGYAYRTFGGHYEEDSIGFLWMVLGIAFLIRAVREPAFTKENIIYATLSGLAFGVMAFTWQVFVIVPLLIEAYFVGTLIWNLIKKVDFKEIKAFAGLVGICFVITAILGTISLGSEWYDIQASYAKGFFGIEGGQAVNNVGSGVGEENTGHQFFGTKYGLYNIFIILGLIAGLYALYRKKSDYVTMMFLAWGLLTLYLAWNKLKATYWFGLGLSVLTSLFFAELYVYVEKYKKNLSLKLGAIVIGILLLAGGVASAVIFVENHAPGIVTEPGWQDALLWFRDNAPDNAKVLNWWNWGHWLTFISHKRTSTDNTNADGQANKDWAAFVVDTNIQKSLGIIKAYDADYVIMPADDVAAQQYYATLMYNVSGNDYRVSNRMGIPIICNRSLNPITNSNEYNCGGNKFNETQMNGFATAWQSQPNDVMQGKTPVFYYTNPQKSRFWVLNVNVNNSTAAKLWFNNIDIKPYFDLVYDNGHIKIWKVNKPEFTNIEMHMTDMNLEQINEWNSKLWWLEENK